MESSTDIKNLVRERYGDMAKRASDPLPRDACCGATAIYSSVELVGLPGSVTRASDGCGNPSALAEIKPGEYVLDLGSGGGIDCFLGGRAVGSTGRVVGVDMTPDMVFLAKKNARLLGSSNVEFLLADMEQLPLKEHTVDVVISNCVINLSPDKERVFQEAFRVLRPGGRFHVSDILLEKDLPEAISNDLDRLLGCIAGADLKNTYLDRLRRAGFVDIDIPEAINTPTEGAELDGVLNAKVVAIKPLA